MPRTRSWPIRRLRRLTLLGVMGCSGLLAVTLAAPALTQTTQPTWTITPGPTSGYGLLSDVFAVSPANAWAVGAQAGGGTGRDNQLIEHWNGRQWQVAAVPPVSQFSTRLLSVSGTSATDIWAVGDQQTSDTGPYPPEVTLIMHWNGVSWTRVPSPNPGAFVNRLEFVKAFGHSDVWASGFFQNADGLSSSDLLLHWNGASWSQVATPDPALQVAGGTSGSDVWFTGSTSLWHFNGTTFTPVPGPVSHTIVAISPTDAWGLSTVNGADVLNHWNGTTWTTVTTLPASDQLSGLAALSATDVWAVGAMNLPDYSEVTLTMRWNGTIWTTVPSPNPSPGFLPALTAAATAAPSTVLAVGIGSGASGNQTLAMVTNNG